MRIILLLIMCLICGCVSEPHSKITLDLPNPEPISMIDYPISVYTIDGNAKICVDGKGYESMAKNMLELKRYIIQQREIIKSYKQYYEQTNENINN